MTEQPGAKPTQDHGDNRRFLEEPPFSAVTVLGNTVATSRFLGTTFWTWSGHEKGPAEDVLSMPAQEI